MTRLNTRKTMPPRIRNKPGFIAKAFAFFLALAILSFLPSVGYAWDAAAYNAGKSTGSDMHSKLNNTGKIRQRFSNPMTSNGTAMTTMDDSQSFTAQLTAPSSDVFLDLFVTPSGTGDLTTVTLRQDTNFDGTPDYAYSLSSPVSGVCSNGFISATPGTWDSRHYYVWSADSLGKVTAVEVPSMMSLAGCYCINASCGSNLSWTNIDLILRDLGGGVVSAIQQQRNFTITNVDITGTEIKYYGQASTNMGDTTGVYFSGTATPQQYYAGGEGTLPGGAELASQAGDPNSMYSQLNVLSNNIGNQYTTKQCSIQRDASIDSDIIDNISCPSGYTLSGGACIATPACPDGGYVVAWADQCYKDFDYNDCARCTQRDPREGFCIAWECTYGVPEYHEYASCSSSDHMGCSGGWGPYPQCPAGGAYNTDTDRCEAVIICPEGYELSSTGGSPKCVKDSGGMSIVDTCGGIDLTDCTMLEETVCDHDDTACVYAYQNYNPTGLTPLGSCYTQVSPYTGLTWTFCADGSSLTYQQGAQSGVLESGTDIWWNIHRTYTCEAHNVYDFTKAQQRAGHIQNTLSDNSTTLTFQDFNPDTGTTTNNSISLPPREDVERCEKSCIVKIPVQDTQASLTGTTANYRASVNTHKEILRACANGVCPVNTGEVLIKDCQCTNYFNQAATTLQLVHDAGRDMICSGSPP